MQDLTNLEKATRNKEAARRLRSQPAILDAAKPEIEWMLDRTDLAPDVRDQLSTMLGGSFAVERVRLQNEIEWRLAELKAGPSATRREYAQRELDQALAKLAELDGHPDEQETELLRGCFDAVPERF